MPSSCSHEMADFLAECDYIGANFGVLLGKKISMKCHLATVHLKAFAIENGGVGAHSEQAIEQFHKIWTGFVRKYCFSHVKTS